MKIFPEIDVAVIGLGAGGSAVIRKLAGNGLKIVGFDQGTFVDYSKLSTIFASPKSKSFIFFIKLAPAS